MTGVIQKQFGCSKSTYIVQIDMMFICSNQHPSYGKTYFIIHPEEERNFTDSDIGKRVSFKVVDENIGISQFKFAKIINI